MNVRLFLATIALLFVCRAATAASVEEILRDVYAKKIVEYNKLIERERNGAKSNEDSLRRFVLQSIKKDRAPWSDPKLTAEENYQALKKTLLELNQSYVDKDPQVLSNNLAAKKVGNRVSIDARKKFKIKNHGLINGIRYYITALNTSHGIEHKYAPKVAELEAQMADPTAVLAGFKAEAEKASAAPYCVTREKVALNCADPAIPQGYLAYRAAHPFEKASQALEEYFHSTNISKHIDVAGTEKNYAKYCRGNEVFHKEDVASYCSCFGNYMANNMVAFTQRYGLDSRRLMKFTTDGFSHCNKM